jgi:hypothetical protein
MRSAERSNGRADALEISIRTASGAGLLPVHNVSRLVWKEENGKTFVVQVESAVES